MLGLALGLRHIAEPGLGPPILARVPLIVPRLQHIFFIKRRASCPHAQRLPARGLQQQFHRQLAALEGRGQQLDHCLAVRLGRVRPKEQAALLVHQEFQLGRAGADGPGHFGQGVGPGQIAKHRQAPLQKAAVELRVVRDDQLGRVHQGAHGRCVDVLAAHRLGRNAGQLRNRVRHRHARVFQIGQRLAHRVDAAGVGRELKRHSAELDDVVVLVVAAGRFHVHRHGHRQRRAVRRRIARGRLEAPQHFVAPGLLQGRDHAFQAVIHFGLCPMFVPPMPPADLAILAHRRKTPPAIDAGQGLTTSYMA